MSVEIYIDDLKPDIKDRYWKSWGSKLQKMGIMILSLFSA